MIKITKEIYILTIFHKYDIIKFSNVEEYVKKKKKFKNNKIRWLVIIAFIII